MYKVHLLPASFGDSILIEYGVQSSHFILIDGGPYYNFKHVMDSIRTVTPNLLELELLVVTHIDIDHIDGIILLLKAMPFRIKEIWFNGFMQIQSFVPADILGKLQGEYLSALIKQKQIPLNTSLNNGIVVVDSGNVTQIKLGGGMKLILLGPSRDALRALASEWEAEKALFGSEDEVLEKLYADSRYEAPDLLGTTEDKSTANRSSIAFIAEYEGKRCLFSGDLTTPEMLKSINQLLAAEGTTRLKLDAWKLSHHGSTKSTKPELMQKIECKNILISTDGKRYGHPDQECIQNLINNYKGSLNFYFNYKTTFNQLWHNSQVTVFTSFFPDDRTKAITCEI